MILSSFNSFMIIKGRQNKLILWLLVGGLGFKLDVIVLKSGVLWLLSPQIFHEMHRSSVLICQIYPRRIGLKIQIAHMYVIASGDTAAKCCRVSIYEVLFEHRESLWEHLKSRRGLLCSHNTDILQLQFLEMNLEG